MHDRRSENDDDAIVSVRKRDVQRWNAASDTVEKGTFFAKMLGKIGVGISVGVSILAGMKGFWK